MEDEVKSMLEFNFINAILVSIPIFIFLIGSIIVIQELTDRIKAKRKIKEFSEKTKWITSITLLSISIILLIIIG